jgi:hypothetical protein
MKDEELDQLLFAAREEPWPPDRLGPWRTRVLEAAARPRRAWLWWIPAPALAAGLLAVWLWPAPSRSLEMQVSLAAPAVDRAAWKRVPRLASDPPLKVVRPQPVPQMAEAPKTVRRVSTEFIQIMTDDPNVVILLAMNGRRDDEQ